MQIRGNYLFNMNASYGIGSRRKADFPEITDLLSHMDRLGIDGAAVYNVLGRDYQPTPANRQLMDDIENNPEAKKRLLPVFCVAPQMFYNKSEMDYLVGMVSSGKVGIVTLFSSAYHSTLLEHERVLDELRPYKPTVIVDYQDFYALKELSGKFPEMFFIVRNNIWWSEPHLADLMWKCSNIGFETSWVHTSFGIPLFAARQARYPTDGQIAQ